MYECKTGLALNEPCLRFPGSNFGKKSAVLLNSSLQRGLPQDAVFLSDRRLHGRLGGSVNDRFERQWQVSPARQGVLDPPTARHRDRAKSDITLHCVQ